MKSERQQCTIWYRRIVRLWRANGRFSMFIRRLEALDRSTLFCSRFNLLAILAHRPGSCKRTRQVEEGAATSNPTALPTGIHCRYPSCKVWTKHSPRFVAFEPRNLVTWSLDRRLRAKQPLPLQENDGQRWRGSDQSTALDGWIHTA